MIGTFLAWASATPWALRLARWGAIALAILLFLLALRRSGERAGRMAERIEAMEKANEIQRWMLRLGALAIVGSLLGGCATGGSEPRLRPVCPPVVEYSEEVQARVADELGLLPGGSMIVEMLSDYAVMREQARSCTSDDRSPVAPP